MKKLIAVAYLAVTFSVLQASGTKVYTTAELQNMTKDELAKVNNIAYVRFIDTIDLALTPGIHYPQYIQTNSPGHITICTNAAYYRFINFPAAALHTTNPIIPPHALPEAQRSALISQDDKTRVHFDLFDFYDRYSKSTQAKPLQFERLDLLELATQIDEAKHATGLYAQQAEQTRKEELEAQKQRKAEEKFKKEKPHIQEAYQALIQQAKKIAENTEIYELPSTKFLQAFQFHDAQLYFTCPYGTARNAYQIIYYGSLLCYACAQGMIDLAKNLLNNDLATPEYINHNFDAGYSAYHLLMYAQLGADGLYQRLTDEQCTELVQLLQSKGAKIPENINGYIQATKTRKNTKGENVVFGPMDKSIFVQNFLTPLVPAAQAVEDAKA